MFMDFPKGTLIKENQECEDLLQTIKQTIDKKFTGYLTITINGYGGVEEGIFVLNGGKVIMAEYIHLRFGKNLAGDKALPYIFNIIAKRKGVLNLVSLETREMDYVLEINEKYRISKPFDIFKIEKFVPKEYNIEIVKKLEEEIIQIALQNRETVKLLPLGKIVLEAKEKQQIMKRLKIDIEKITSEAEKIAIMIKGGVIEQPEFKIRNKLMEELNKLECIKVKNISCRIFEKEKEIKFNIKMVVFLDKLKEPISNEEVLKQVIEKLAKAVVEEELPEYKNLNIKIEYNIERVK